MEIEKLPETQRKHLLDLILKSSHEISSRRFYDILTGGLLAMGWELSSIDTLAHEIVDLAQQLNESNANRH